MSRSRLPVLLVLAVSLLVLASCQPLPVVVPVTTDPATSLYTIPFYDGANLVIDIAGPIVWSTCQRGHLPAKLPCKSETCKLANAYPVQGCRASGCGHDARKDRTSCTAYPYNPVSTTAPYTVLRPDVYRPFVAAFGKAVAAQWEYAQKPRQVKPVPPFGLCYDARTLSNTRLGYMVPRVTLALDSGKNWTMTGVNSMVNVKPGKACLAFVEMKAGDDGKAPAAVIIGVGGFQMENFVLQFDLEKKRFGFVKLPYYANCGHFNFTRSA